MAEKDLVAVVARKSSYNDEREATGSVNDVTVMLEKYSYPLRNGGESWKVEAYNYNKHIKESETGLDAKEADQLFEELMREHGLKEVESDE